jgi:MFS family permease
MPELTQHQQTRARDPMVFAVCALGISQITAWGTSLYILGVLAGPIAADTGWSRSLVFFGFTLALLAMAVVSTSVGRAIDRHGARLVMSIGTVLVSAGLVALSQVTSEGAYLAAWVFLGFGMRLVLYDAAFAALVQIVPSRGRRAISYLTLFGAFASTIFWVVGHYLNEAVGWRQTVVLFAVINLIVCLPLNWYGLARRESTRAADAPEPAASVDGPPLEGRVRTVAMALFAVVMSLNAFVFGVITVQLVPLLEAAGLATAAAVWVASMKGFAQFGGRVVEIVFARNLRSISVARITVGVLAVAFAILLAAQGNLYLILAFTLLMGASQGVISIVRGALPLALFGTDRYATVLGMLATPILIVNAASPTLFALIVDQYGWQNAQLLLATIAVIACVAMEMMSRWYERTRRRAGTG